MGQLPTRNPNILLVFVSMVRLTQLIPEVLDQVNPHAKGWDTKIRLVTLVAWRTQAHGSWTELGAAELAELGRRERWESLWDIEVLDRLAGEHRILSKIGRGPHRTALFRVAGDDLARVREWRRVPWIRSASAALSSLRAVAARVDSVGSPVEAGQRPFRSPVDPPHRGFPGHQLSVVPPDSPPRQPDSTPNPHAQIGPTTGLPTEPDAPPTQCFSGVLRTPSLSREGGSERSEPKEAAKAVAATLGEVLGKPIFGPVMLERCAAVADRYAQDGGLLEERIARFAGTHSIVHALDTLMALPLGPPPATTDPAVLRAQAVKLAAQIAALRALELDDDEIAPLEARLAAVESRMTVTGEG